MGNLATLSSCSFGDLGMAVSQVADADTRGHVEQLDTLVRSDPAALAVLKDVPGETTDSLGDVGLAESGGVHVGCWHCRAESLNTLYG